MWSKDHLYTNVDPEDGVMRWYASTRNARWFIPNFDESRWWHAIGNSMISTVDLDPSLPFQHLNEIQPDAWILWTCKINFTEQFIPALYSSPTFSQDFWTYYSQTPSDNNLDNWVPRPSSMSQFCQNDWWYWCRTITIVKTGYYHISLQWVFQIDHNVHAFRYACLRYNIGLNKLDLIVDSKFWWGNGGSSSLSDPLIPRTNEYNLWGTKIVLLQAGDILFPAVKIDPRVLRPKQERFTTTTPGGDQDVCDVLYELNAKGMWPPYTPDKMPWYGNTYHVEDLYSDSWPYSNLIHTQLWSAWITWNFSATKWWWNVPNNALPWIPANLPNVSPHYFTPNGMWTNGAENYGWNLIYPGGNGDGAFGEYRRDDWVVTIYWPSSRFNSDWSWTVWKADWATLAVHRVNNKQSDEIDYIPV
jgi:hypothetical protein